MDSGGQLEILRRVDADGDQHRYKLECMLVHVERFVLEIGEQAGWYRRRIYSSCPFPHRRIGAGAFLILEKLSCLVLTKEEWRNQNETKNGRIKRFHGPI